MSGDNCHMAGEIATLNERTKTHGREVNQLFASNEKRKHDINEVQKDQLGVAHAMEEMGTKIDHIAETMDTVVTRLEALESKSFDWSKVMGALGKPYILYPILLTILGVTITVFAPESLADFFKLADKIPGVK
jgi:hypothetical protein